MVLWAILTLVVGMEAGKKGDAGMTINALSYLWPDGSYRAAFPSMSEPEFQEWIQSVLADRDRLREAIKVHREDIWGDGPVEHYDDSELYSVLGETEE